MAACFEDFVEITQGVADLGTLNKTFYEAVAAEGYENLVFLQAGGRRPLDIICSEFPDGYLAQYHAEKWHQVDPVLRHSRIAKHPFLWRDVVDPSRQSREEQRFFSACDVIGVRAGVTMPFHNPDGRTHVVSVSLRKGAKPDEKRIPYIYALAAQTWIRHCALAGQLGEPQVEPIRLTNRERECLSWAKEGKTNWEISQILSLAERTVEFHVGNAMRKLNASNRVTAIVIAIQEGLISM